MDDMIFMEVANEIKALHNSAVGYIRQRDYASAAIQYRKALIITEKISYLEGSGMTLFSMANLALLVGDYIEAICNAADARDMFIKAGAEHEHCDALLQQLALAAKKKGIEYERKGMFQAAIEHYEACMPFSDAKSRQAMQHEIELIRRVADA